jgi:CubicO group peptidase (beta-lactamase class C family)
MPGPIDAGPIDPAPIDRDLIDRARRWAFAWQRGRRVPGMALVVTDRTRTVLAEVSGLADRAGMRPATADQRWQIGSISKAFTSIAVLQLQKQGRLSVHDRVGDHLPWASHLHPDITLHHLMTHTAGLPNGSEWTPDSLLESAVQGQVGSPQPPGGRYHYSNPGYELLGDVVETVTGQVLETFLEQQVLHPLGMEASAGAIAGEDRDRDVRGHRPPRDDVLWRGQSEQVPDAFFPSCTADGAIVATPEDMAAYLRFLLAGEVDGVLDRASFETLSARHASAGQGWYGYGLRTDEIDGRVVLGHGGGMVGMYADVKVDRERGIGTCMLANGHSDVWEANAYVLALLCGGEPAEPRWPLPEPLDDPAGGQHLEQYVGLYRSYNPWVPTLRVLRANGELRLADPVSGTQDTLHPVTETRFGVDAADSPDVVEFGVEVAGRFQRLELSGSVYGRVRRDAAG